MLAADTSLKERSEKITYRIIHATKGRIRIGMPRLREDETYTDRFERAIASFNGITNVCINTKAHSAIVYYNAKEISIVAVQKYIAIAIQRALTPPIPPHTSSALAKRFGIAFQSLTWHRERSDFALWSQTKDPEEVAWIYDAESKLFHPLEYRLEKTVRLPSREERILQTLGEATSGKVGGMLGKVAGGAIGFALLGAVGVVLGEEIGVFLGETIGGELGRIG
jgi:Heavy metal associated domain 2